MTEMELWNFFYRCSKCKSFFPRDRAKYVRDFFSFIFWQAIECPECVHFFAARWTENFRCPSLHVPHWPVVVTGSSFFRLVRFSANNFFFSLLHLGNRDLAIFFRFCGRGTTSWRGSRMMEFEIITWAVVKHECRQGGCLEIFFNVGVSTQWNRRSTKIRLGEKRVRIFELFSPQKALRMDLKIYASLFGQIANILRSYSLIRVSWSLE